MPPTMGGITIPYESGQSGTARPEPVEVTIAPAKMRNSVDPATSLVYLRNQTGVSSERRSASGAASKEGFIVLRANTCLRRRRGDEPLPERVLRVDEHLPSHPVVTETTKLRAGDLPFVVFFSGFVRQFRCELDGDLHPR